MKCPKCKGRTAVTDSRTNDRKGYEKLPDELVYRRRACQSCGFSFSTREITDESIDALVRKRTSNLAFKIREALKEV